MAGPFDDDDKHLSSSSVATLREWLEKYAHRETVIAEGYTVGQLINHLVEMENGIWNDGIDAMGEDA